jgi:MFS family permease
MPKIARILLSGLIGAIICGILSFLMFFLLTVFDNQKLIEAFAYGLIVGIIGAFVGVIIGLAVGIGNVGAVGGGVVGFLGTIIVVAIYVYSTAENFGQYGYFLSESRIIFVVLSLPTILTGIITALLVKLIYKP